MAGVNGNHYFLLREAEEFANRSSRILWDAKRRALVLAQNQHIRLPAGDATAALSAWQTAQTIVLDQFGQQGRIAAGNQQLEYNAGRGFLPLLDGDLQPVNTPAGDFVDIAVGGDGRLAAIYSDNGDNHGVVLMHLAKRWQVATPLPERPLRVCVDKDNKVWVATASELICCAGEPLPHTYRPRGDRFEPTVINPHPLQTVWQSAWPSFTEPLALCTDDDKLTVLVHDGSGNQHLLQRSLMLGQAELNRFAIDNHCPFAIDARALSSARFALLAPAQAGDTHFIQRDCPIVQLQVQGEAGDGDAVLIRERYPMLSQQSARFVSSVDNKVRYQAQVETGGEEAQAGFSMYPQLLQALQRPRYYSAAMTTLTEELDAGQPDVIWHRLYLEGCIPPGCKVTVYAKTYNNPDLRTSTPFVRQPDWIWCAHRSDQAFGQGLVTAKKNHGGLFELLLQRNKGPVRRLQGRYLQLRLQLESNGQHTPAIHALKVYYPRLSYQETYLPEHFRQEYEIDPARDHLPANGADLRERLFAAFEGVLTPLEKQMASADVLLNPDSTPAPHLSWLGELLGQNLPDHWPEARRRRWLAATGDLQRWRGTLPGLHLALDIITDGAVARGQVVAVENFRLRRTMATILGVDMEDEDHPLTLGTGMSGNSIVGDSLILAEADAREFLSLFSADLADAKEQKIVEEFFSQYANQVTVLLHGSARKQKAAVESALREYLPAHLQWQLVETDHPFVLGLAPLLGVDTFVEQQPTFKRVTLNDTYLGREGLLQNPAALSPKDVNRIREM